MKRARPDAHDLTPASAAAGGEDLASLQRGLAVWGWEQEERYVQTDHGRELESLRFNASVKTRDLWTPPPAWPIADIKACSVSLEVLDARAAVVATAPASVYEINGDVYDIASISKNNQSLCSPWPEGEPLRARFWAVVPRVAEPVCLADFEFYKPEKFGCFGPNSREAMGPVNRAISCSLGARAIENRRGEDLTSIAIIGRFEDDAAMSAP